LRTIDMTSLRSQEDVSFTRTGRGRVEMGESTGLLTYLAISVQCIFSLLTWKKS